MLSPQRLDEILDRFARLSIGLVGDLFLDQYLEVSCELQEISIETDREAYQIDRVRSLPGALGTVAKNLKALGVGRVRPFSVVGDDGRAVDLLHGLREWDIETDGIIREPGRLTPTYTKPMKRQADNSPAIELNRLDIRTRGPLANESVQQLTSTVKEQFSQCDGWIVLDQVNEVGWGVIEDVLCAELATLAAADSARFVMVDSRQRLAEFHNMILKGNDHEICSAAGETEPLSALRKLAERTQRCTLCTCGAAGIWVGIPGEQPTLAPALTVAGPVDIVGAGDMVSAAFTAARLAGGTLLESAECANLAAFVTVQKLGTTGEATSDELRHACRHMVNA
jgi:rfaE bifunctional protein kinase chain/domain